MSKLLSFSLVLLLLSGSGVFAQCPNDNIFYETIPAPTATSSQSTELFGGEYSTVTGLVAGTTYRISNCGDNAFDSQITIYRASGGVAQGYNDDYETCPPQSTIYFTPLTSGDYHILADLYNCDDFTGAFTTIDLELEEEAADVISIPVVVHVIYNNLVENITDQQIQSQIDVLNQDFRRQNADLSSVPARFRGFSMDTRIEFCLASVDPDSLGTTGITRTSSSHGPFDPSDEDMKFDNQGGHDVWDRDRYLNFWICDLSGGVLGYAQFPGLGATTDGVVIDYQYFGTMGTATPPFNLGRTATHEVGHWLNLRHIWGDDGGACTGTDQCGDTPNQAGSNFGCPSNDPSSCSNEGFGGDMYVNYMDYSDDACLSMFTYHQHLRMQNTLFGSRASLQNSSGCNLSVAGQAAVSPELKLEVFPNPAGNESTNEYVTFRLQTGNKTPKGLQFALYDAMGQKLVAINDLNQKTFKIQTSNLSAGVYFYSIIGPSEGQTSGKLIIQ